MASAAQMRKELDGRKGSRDFGDAVMNVLTGGHDDLDEMVDMKYDYRAEAINNEIQLQLDAGLITEAEAEIMRRDRLAENESSRDSDMSSVKMSQGFMAGVTIATSFIGVGGGNKAFSKASGAVAKELAGELGEEAAEKLAKESVEKLGVYLAKNVTGEVTGEAAEKLMKEAAEQVGKEMLEELTGKYGKEMAEKMSQNITKQLATGALKDITGEVGEKAIKEMLESTVKELGENALGDAATAGTKKAATLSLLGKFTDNKAFQVVKNIAELPSYATARLTGGIGSVMGKSRNALLSSVGNLLTTKTGYRAVGLLTGYEIGNLISDQYLGRISDKTMHQICELDEMIKHYVESDGEIVTKRDETEMAILDEYVSNVASLEEALQSGLISEDEYLNRMEQVVQAATDNRDELNSYLKEYGEYALTEGVANKLADFHIEHGYITEYCEEDMVAPKLKEYGPEDLDERIQASIKTKYGACSNEFTAFFATINATIIKYVPAVATVEAAILKAADSTFDIIRDAVVHEDRESRYQDMSISEIAAGIKDFSADHLEKRSEHRELKNSVSTMDIDEFYASTRGSGNDAQDDEQQTAEQSGQQSEGYQV